MAKLQWGADDQRRYEMGVSHGVLYLRGQKGVAWNGLTSVSERPTGADPVDLWADNSKYASFRAVEEFEATIEAYQYPTEFEECDGGRRFSEGAWVRQQRRKPFDFSFRTEVLNASNSPYNKGYKLHLIWNATASPSERQYETVNDSPDAMTYSWELSTVPTEIIGRHPTSHMIIDSTRVDRLKLEAIEKILYGTATEDARMPDAEEVLTILQLMDIHRAMINILSADRLWIWDTFNFYVDSVPIAIEREANTHMFPNPEAGTTYLQPSVAYALISETDSQKIYSVAVIDEDPDSPLAIRLADELGLQPAGERTHVGNFYYFWYTLTI